MTSIIDEDDDVSPILSLSLSLQNSPFRFVSFNLSLSLCLGFWLGSSRKRNRRGLRHRHRQCEHEHEAFNFYFWAIFPFCPSRNSQIPILQYFIRQHQHQQQTRSAIHARQVRIQVGPTETATVSSSSSGFRRNRSRSLRRWRWAQLRHWHWCSRSSNLDLPRFSLFYFLSSIFGFLGIFEQMGNSKFWSFFFCFTKLYLLPLKFGVIFILRLYVLKFSFWPIMFHYIFVLVRHSYLTISWK